MRRPLADPLAEAVLDIFEGGSLIPVDALTIHEIARRVGCSAHDDELKRTLEDLHGRRLLYRYGRRWHTSPRAARSAIYGEND